MVTFAQDLLMSLIQTAVFLSNGTRCDGFIGKKMCFWSNMEYTIGEEKKYHVEIVLIKMLCL